MFEDFAYFQAQFPYAVWFLVFVVGAAFGSFINVVAYRLPTMLERDWRNQALEIMDDAIDGDLPAEISALKPDPEERFNLLYPNSRCPHCENPIKPWQNIPVAGYLLLKGKCASCKKAISPRYPIVEFVTAVLTLAVVIHFGVNWTGLAACVLTWVLIALSLIDYDTSFLPDDLTLPFLWVGLIVNFFNVFATFTSAFIGACAGYLFLWSVYQLFKLVTGKEGMGYGDFKLLAMLGAWLGVASLPLIIILSSFAGAIIGGSLILLGRDKAKPIPFGPYLAIAGWISMMWGPELIDLYLRVAT